MLRYKKLLNTKEGVDKMLDIAICDGNLAMADGLESALEKIVQKKIIPMNIEVFLSGKELITYVENGAYFDIIFLNIEMIQEDGITVAEKIREKDKNVLIIYVTSRITYIQQVFPAPPFQLLIKPVDDKLMEQCLLQAYKELGDRDSYFRYTYERIHYKILMKDILYFESRKRKIYIVTKKKEYEFYGKLQDVEVAMRSGKMMFLRIHQSFLVNYRHVEVMAYDYVVMDNGKRLGISQDRRKQISRQYGVMEEIFHIE